MALSKLKFVDLTGNFEAYCSGTIRVMSRIVQKVDKSGKIRGGTNLTLAIDDTKTKNTRTETNI